MYAKVEKIKDNLSGKISYSITQSKRSRFKDNSMTKEATQIDFASNQVITETDQNSILVQGKFKHQLNDQTADEVADYLTKSIAKIWPPKEGPQFNKNNRKMMTILKLLAKDEGINITLEYGEKEKECCLTIWRLIKAHVPTAVHDGKANAYKGDISEEKLLAMKAWELDAKELKSIQYNKWPGLQAQYFTFAHVTTDVSNFDGKKVVTDIGTGEYGSGFYTVSGGEKQAAEAISKHWSKNNKKKFEQVVLFKIEKEKLWSLLEVPEGDCRTLVAHMIDMCEGYPQGWDKQKILATMNTLNTKSLVLVMPDDKKEKVIKGPNTKETDWLEGYNDVQLTDHVLVIGPQKPDQLNRVRQIAFRGMAGDLMINEATRSVAQV